MCKNKQYRSIHASNRSRLEASEPSMQMQPENTSRASDGPVKTRQITSENSECEYVKREQYRSIHASNRSRLEAGEPSMQMQPESTSRASDGPVKTRPITTENGECEYVKQTSSID